MQDIPAGDLVDGCLGLVLGFGGCAEIKPRCCKLFEKHHLTGLELTK